MWCSLNHGFFNIFFKIIRLDTCIYLWIVFIDTPNLNAMFSNEIFFLHTTLRMTLSSRIIVFIFRLGLFLIHHVYHHYTEFRKYFLKISFGFILLKLKLWCSSLLGMILFISRHFLKFLKILINQWKTSWKIIQNQ